MRHRTAVTGAAALCVALSLSIAAAVPAAASLARLGAHEPRPAQVNGYLLAYALVPPLDFGDSVTAYEEQHTGRGLLSTHPQLSIPAMSCASFSGEVRDSGFGNTAGVVERYYSPQWAPLVWDGYQQVLQFATVRAADVYYSQAETRYRTCQIFTQPDPDSAAPIALGAPSTDSVSAAAVTPAAVGTYQAFQVDQSYYGAYGDNLLVAVAGTDVYVFWQQDDFDNEPPVALMAELIQRVQQLHCAGTGLGHCVP